MKIKDPCKIYSAYKEFADADDAERAARILREAGFENVDTEDLSHSLKIPSDFDMPASDTDRYFGLDRMLTGALAGVEFGLLVFGLPPLILGMQHAAYIVVAGTLVCTVAGAIIVWFEGAIFAKRNSREASGRVGDRAIGVRVQAENSREILRAKALLAH